MKPLEEIYIKNIQRSLIYPLAKQLQINKVTISRFLLKQPRNVPHKLSRAARLCFRLVSPDSFRIITGFPRKIAFDNNWIDVTNKN